MITILGIILSLLGVLGLFSPKTSFGKKLTNLIGIDLLLYYQTFRKIIFYLTVLILILIIYLISLVLDFYKIHLAIFNFLYLLSFACLVSLIFFNKGISSFRSYFIKYFFMLIAFLLIVSAISTYFKKSIDNNNFETQFENCLNNKTISEVLFLNELNIRDFRDRYTIEYMFISRLNKLILYQSQYDFKIDLSMEKYNESTPFSKLYNELLYLYHNNKFHSFALEYFEKKAKDCNPIQKTFIIPLEFQPDYIGHSIIQYKTKYFASLSAGGKILILDFFITVTSNIKAVGIYFSLPFIFLLSLFLTKKLSHYNNNYEDNFNNKKNYLFVFSTILGLFIAILSLLK